MLDWILDWSVLITWIFGGCCSNVYALEAIIKEEPDSGNLITFTQFLVVTLLTLPSHFSSNASSFFLKPRAVPLLRWVPNIVLFFAVNLLNNSAFGYNISVPVHIILRSGGSVMTMLVGWAWGKKYSQIQVLSVVMLTIGIITAAMSDAQSKVNFTLSHNPHSLLPLNTLLYAEESQGKSLSSPTLKFDPSLLTGLSILFIAQLLSAIMGLYVQLTYAKYGSHWHENLFYSHALSVPLFLPFFPSLIQQFKQLSHSSPFVLSPSLLLDNAAAFTNGTASAQLPPITKTPGPVAVPRHVVSLLLNAGTQFACIRGVNVLASRTSAVGVSIALNVRKLVSLFISIMVFGNVLPLGVEVGAAIVFASAGLWAWEEGRLGRERERTKRVGGEKKVQ